MILTTNSKIRNTALPILLKKIQWAYVNRKIFVALNKENIF